MSKLSWEDVVIPPEKVTEDDHAEAEMLAVLSDEEIAEWLASGLPLAEFFMSSNCKDCGTVINEPHDYCGECIGWGKTLH